MGKGFGTFAAAAALLLVASDADAFCRSTSCRETKSNPCPTDENGCNTKGAPLFWPTSCLSYATNRLGTESHDPIETRPIIKKTFDAWSDVKCPDGTTAAMTFTETDPIPCKRSEYNKNGPNVNVVLFQDAKWNYRGIDGTLAKTSVTYNDETGEIYDADIEVNTAYNEVTITDEPLDVEYDLQAILTHEVGHFIGIAHSSDPSAVMFASYSPGSLTQRRLHPDDIEAVCTTYPENEARECNPEPRNGFSATCGSDDDDKTLCSVEPGKPSSPLGLGVAFMLASAVAVSARRRKSQGEHR
jgi:hypothetical protein